MSEDVHVGEHYPSNKALPIEAGHFYDRLWLDADGTVQGLQESWQRPVRHNLSWESSALWHSLHLDTACSRALDNSELCVFPLRPTYANAEARYEIEAAIHLIPDVVPFSSEEKARLLGQGRERHAETWAELANSREPELVSRWHRWLWGRPDDDHEMIANDYGRASLLHFACLALVKNLPAVLCEE